MIHRASPEGDSRQKWVRSINEKFSWRTAILIIRISDCPVRKQALPWYRKGSERFCKIQKLS